MEIEYYCRDNNYHGIGTFHQLDDKPIKKGTKFIVPSNEKFVGCCEGRENHAAFKKPLLLICKGSSLNHVISEGHGSYRRDLVFVEND